MEKQMLTKEQIEQKKEEVFSAMYETWNKSLVPMTQAQSNRMTVMLIADGSGRNNMYSKLSQLFTPSAFFTRVELMDIKFDRDLKIWMAFMFYEYGIGAMLLIANYLQYAVKKDIADWPSMQQALDRRLLSFDFAIERFFRHGVPTMEYLHRYWDMQKVPMDPDNLIDYINVGK